MTPAFPEGTRLRLDGTQLTRGEPVVFRPRLAPRRLDLKRLIGLPGEEVAWDGRGAVWIDGRLLEEPYAHLGPAVPGDDERGAVRLGPEEYFVIGDNRLYSRDSRRDGPVAAAALVGVLRRPGG